MQMSNLILYIIELDISLPAQLQKHTITSHTFRLLKVLPPEIAHNLLVDR